METFDNFKAFLKKIVSKTGSESKVTLFQNGFIFKESALFDKKVSWVAPLP